MPLVQVHLPDHLSPQRIAAILDGVHQAMVETIDVPAADRFQSVTVGSPARLRLDPSYLAVQRGPGAFVVHITLRRGRTPDKKRALYRRMTEILQATASVRPQDVMIVLHENDAIDWSFGNGEAQNAPLTAAA